MKKHSIVVLTMVIVVLALATSAMAADPFVGTWKLNLAKSKFNDGWIPKSWTVRIKAMDNGLTMEGDLINADGKVDHSEDTTYRFDGKDYLDPSSPGLFRSCTRPNANRYVCVFKQDGKETGRWVDVISRDGKTAILTDKGKNDKGQEYNNTYVWDRQ
jgi:hypothetical protein